MFSHNFPLVSSDRIVERPVRRVSKQGSSDILERRMEIRELTAGVSRLSFRGDEDGLPEDQETRSPTRRRSLLEAYQMVSQEEDLVELPCQYDTKGLEDAVEIPVDRYTRLRAWGQILLRSLSFQGVVAVLIILNALVIGFETDRPDMLSWDTVEQVLLVCFTLELGLRIFVLEPSRFFSIHSTDFVWNVFDMCIVGMGIIDFACQEVLQAHGQVSIGGGFPTLFRLVRLLRILRIFRLIRFLKRLYILAYGFSLAAVAVFWVACLMAGLLYFCAIILVRTVGRMPEDAPDAEFFGDRFGSIGQAMFSLFQLAVQPNLIEYEVQMNGRPLLALFLVIFVIFGSFGMIALLTGVISEAMFEKNIMRLEDQRAERELVRNNILASCTEMFDELDRNHLDEVSPVELTKLIPKVAVLFEDNNVPYTKHDLEMMIELMDTDGSGAINRAEFCRGILQVAEEVRPMFIMELHYDSLSYFKGKIEDYADKLDKCQESISEEIERVKSSMSENICDLRRHIVEAPRSPSNFASGGSAILAASASSCSASAASAAGGGGGPALESLVKTLAGDVQTLQGSIFALGVRMEELLSDALSDSVNTQLEELRVRRRCAELEQQKQQQEQSELGLSPKAIVEPAPPPAWITEITGCDKHVAAEIKKLREDMQSLHGGLFSVSNRMEELISDSTSERFQSHCNELAVLRSRSESESAVASRIGQCEFAVLQASGAMKQLEDRTRELTNQVQSLEEGQKKFLESSTRATTPVTLSRSHSLTTSEGRSRTGSMKPEDAVLNAMKLSRSGSRDSRNGQLGAQREGMLNRSLSTGGGDDDRRRQTAAQRDGMLHRSFSTGNETGGNFTLPLPVVSEVGSREGSN